MSYLGRGSNLTRKAQDKVSFLATAGQTVRTGLSYVPTHVDVTVNGITLTEITDYTATNGNSITFTVALALNDEVTIISSKTFDVANHYTISAANALLAAKATIANFTSTGIDDNATSTAVTIDASENVLVGKTTIAGAFNTVGTELRATGLVQSTVDGNKCIDLNRKSSDGAIIGFSKDGAAKGTIGVTSAGAYITLGGTGAANTLDDYEEGTWTASLNTANSNATTSVGNSTGYYTKIGSQVTVWWYSSATNISAAGSGLPLIAGLPFTPDNSGNKYGNPVFGHTTAFSTDPNGYARANGTAIAVTGFNSINSNALVVGNPKYIMVTCTYSA